MRTKTTHRKGLGLAIAAAREKRGWNQRELARRLGVVGQQAVSGWERGVSRPKRDVLLKLAVVLDFEPDELLELAGYELEPEPDTLPVRPLLPTLPLHRLNETDFERFITMIADTLHQPGKAEGVGSRGHKQFGVDVIVRNDSAIPAVYQCKNYKEFGASKVRKAVAAAEIVADEYFLVLSRVASPSARTEMAKHPGWTLLDTEDIARIIHQVLTRDQATRVVGRYFSSHLEDFLGVPDLGPWDTIDEFFDRFGGSFSHGWDLEGRESLLADVVDSVENGNAEATMIIGRGGIGKSRLLLAATSEIEARGATVRFLGSTVDVGLSHFEQLQDCGEKLVIVMDDVHENERFAEIARSVRRLRPDSKFLFASRPHRQLEIQGKLHRANLGSPESFLVPDLTTAEAASLARQILGTSLPENVVERLASLTTDCPLITVLGATLVAEGKLDPTAFETDEEIRREIMVLHCEALFADPRIEDAETRASVVDALAILQPVRLNDREFQQALETLVGKPFDRIMPHISRLEDAGVVLRRGDSARIVPDLLGDVVLSKACFDGVGTNYVERAHQASNGVSLQHVIMNTSRVDWQLRRDAKSSQSFVDAVWDAIDDEFKASGFYQREEIARFLQQVAFFQPDRVLSLARWAIDNPTENPGTKDVFSGLIQRSNEDVLEALGPAIRDCAFHFEYVSEAADLLWELAKRDTRALNPFPNHPMRTLQGICALQTVPLPFCDALIDAVARWVEVDGENPVASALDVLKPLLATEGTVYAANGYTIEMRAFRINPEAVARVRARVVELAFREARSNSVLRAVRGVEMIEESITYPYGLLGQDVSDNDRAEWTPTFIAAIEDLGELVAGPNCDPEVAVAVRRALRRHNEYDLPTNAAAEAAIGRIPATIEHDLAVVLHDSWGSLILGRLADYEESQQKLTEHFRSLAGEIGAKYLTAEAVTLIRERLEAARLSSESGLTSSGQFLWLLTTDQPEIGKAICAEAASDPDSVFTVVSPVVLGALLESEPASGMDFVTQMSKASELPIVLAAARALSNNSRGRATLLPGEIDLLRFFARHDDEAIRMCAITSARRVVDSDRAFASDLVTSIRFGDSMPVAEDFFSSFSSYGPFNWDDLSAASRAAIRSQLTECETIDKYPITDFLSAVSAEDPEWVVELLVARIVREEQRDGDDDLRFQAVPFHWHHALDMRASPACLAILNRLFIWISEDLDSWQRRRHGASLFCEIAGAFDDEILEMLSALAREGGSDRINTVSTILSEAPSTVVWSRVDFVEFFLDAAQACGEETLKRARSCLASSTNETIRSGKPGEPFPQDVDEERRAREILIDLQPGSTIWQFYKSLERSARAAIDRAKESDMFDSDGRPW